MDKILKKLRQLGYSLPTPKKAIASYVPVKQSENLVFVSGQLPIIEDKIQYAGKVGLEITLEEAQKAAQLCSLNILAQLYHSKLKLPNLSPVKLTVFVNSNINFSDIHLVANGASNFFLDIFDSLDGHARSAIGVYNLPLNASVEVEAIFEIKNKE